MVSKSILMWFLTLGECVHASSACASALAACGAFSSQYLGLATHALPHEMPEFATCVRVVCVRARAFNKMSMCLSSFRVRAFAWYATVGYVWT